MAWSGLEWVGVAWSGLEWVGAQFDKARFSHNPKSDDKTFNILRRAFRVKEKAFFILFKRISINRICVRPDSAPLNRWLLIK